MFYRKHWLYHLAAMRMVAVIATVLVGTGATLAFAAPGVTAAHKRALLIAVSKYHRRPDDPPDLNTGGDVVAIGAALEHLGFQKSDVVILTTPEQTKRKSIEQAIAKLADSIKPDDTVYFHFSGHGSVAPDPTLRKLDGYSQAIVPTDFDFSKPDWNTIADLEIHDWIGKLLAKKPSLLTMTFDCCHSGANTRGRYQSRGFERSLPPVKPATASGAILASAPDYTHSNLVVLAACRPDQKAWETDDDQGKPMGLFSYCLSKALAQATAKTTYRELLDHIGTNMSARQSEEQYPQAEGKIDSILMTGIAAVTSQAYLVSRQKGELVMNAGSLQGMTSGSHFSVYGKRAANYQTEKPIAQMTIATTTPTESKLVMSIPGHALPKIDRAFAVENDHCYSGQKLSVFIDIKDDASKSLIATKLAKSQALAVKTSAAEGKKWSVKIAGEGNELLAVRDDGTELIRLPFDEDSAKNDQIALLAKRLESEVRWRYIKGLQNKGKDASIRVELQVVPVTIDSTDDQSDGRPTKITLKPTTLDSKTKWLTMKDKEHFMVQVKNTGQKPVYINLLDLQPNGTIDLLYPNTEINAVNEAVQPGNKWQSIPLPFVFEIKEPFGLETIKVIATAEPADFSALRSAEKAQRAVKEMDPMEQLILSASSGTRGGKTFVAPSTWATASYVMHTAKAD